MKKLAYGESFWVGRNEKKIFALFTKPREDGTRRGPKIQGMLLEN
jgi:hypothetical protein